MKRFFSVLCIIMFVLMFIGCSQNKIEFPQNTNPVNGDDLNHSTSHKTESPENIKVSYFHADWPQYDSIDALVAASSNVFEGKLTNIYFEVIDLYTGEPAGKVSEDSKLQLYTIYEVEVNSSYKGISEEKVYIKVIGGMEGYKESIQCAKLSEYNMYDDVGILVLDKFESLDIGKTYLFLSDGKVGSYYNIINNTQFAYDAMESEKTNGFSFNDVKMHVTNMPGVEK